MKPFRLLIAYDGSEDAKKALQDLSSAGLIGNVEAVILNVVDTWLVKERSAEPAAQNWVTQAVAKNEELRKTLVADAKQTAWDAAQALRARYPTWSIRAEGKADDPAWGIVKYSDVWKPDLIVLGCHGRSAVGRFFLGSVSQKVLNHARGSVRIVHPEAPPARPPRVIIGFDGSRDACKAVTQVAKRDWPAGTQVRLVSVIDEKIAGLIGTGMSLRRPKQTPKARRRFWLDHVSQPALAELKKAGLEAMPVVRDGAPDTILIQEAKRWQATSLFVSARGLIAIERFLLGSVSSQIAANAPCSVEIVR